LRKQRDGQLQKGPSTCTDRASLAALRKSAIRSPHQIYFGRMQIFYHQGIQGKTENELLKRIIEQW